MLNSSPRTSPARRARGGALEALHGDRLGVHGSARNAARHRPRSPQARAPRRSRAPQDQIGVTSRPPLRPRRPWLATAAAQPQHRSAAGSADPCAAAHSCSAARGHRSQRSGQGKSATASAPQVNLGFRYQCYVLRAPNTVHPGWPLSRSPLASAGGVEPPGRACHLHGSRVTCALQQRRACSVPPGSPTQAATQATSHRPPARRVGTQHPSPPGLHRMHSRTTSPGPPPLGPGHDVYDRLCPLAATRTAAAPCCRLRPL